MSIGIANNKLYSDYESSAQANFNFKNLTKKEAIDNSSQSKAEISSLNLTQDFKQFVRLLLQQIKCQDPTEPMKTNEMTQQIVSFTAVEQAVATNKNLEKLVELNQGVQFANAASLVGKEITYDGANVKIDNDVIDGNFVFSLEPAESQDIRKTKIKIVNSKGVIVNTIDGEGDVGLNKIYWNGLDEKNKRVLAGNYKIIVEAYDQNEAAIKVGSSLVKGQVQSSDIYQGRVFVKVNGEKVDVDRIMSLN